MITKTNDSGYISIDDYPLFDFAYMTCRLFIRKAGTNWYKLYCTGYKPLRIPDSEIKMSNRYVVASSNNWLDFLDVFYDIVNEIMHHVIIDRTWYKYEINKKYSVVDGFDKINL